MWRILSNTITTSRVNTPRNTNMGSLSLVMARIGSGCMRAPPRADFGPEVKSSVQCLVVLVT
jgi:hypothetical protein